MGGVEFARGREEGGAKMAEASLQFLNVMPSLKHKWYCLVVLCKQDVPSL